MKKQLCTLLLIGSLLSCNARTHGYIKPNGIMGTGLALTLFGALLAREAKKQDKKQQLSIAKMLAISGIILAFYGFDHS